MRPPILKSIEPTTNFIGLESIFTKPQTPKIPPIIPNEVSGHNKSFLMLPNLKCDIPETKVVKTSEVWTLALAIAGGIPNEISKVDEVTPYPIPKVPSIICAKNPIILNSSIDKLSIIFQQDIYASDYLAIRDDNRIFFERKIERFTPFDIILKLIPDTMNYWNHNLSKEGFFKLSLYPQ